MSERYTRRRIGDRRDGRKLRTVAATRRITPFIMRSRQDASNLLADSVEISAADDWLRNRIDSGMKDISLLHVVIAAYVRTVALCPSINRFVSGRRLFARNGIQVILYGSDPAAGESSLNAIKVDFDPTDTIGDVYRKIGDRIDHVKADYGAESSERLADFLLKLPRFLLRFLVMILRFLDYNGWVPGILLDMSPYHGSLMVCDDGPQGLPPISQHLYDFGNIPLSLSLGKRRPCVEVDEGGRLYNRKYMDICLTMDERITEHARYAEAIKYIKYYISNPVELEKAPRRVLDDEM